MKNIIIRIIISIVVILVISACSEDEESTSTSTTPTYTCTGSSSGTGPTIGGVTLKEATYTQDNNSITFVNSTSANNVHSSSINFCVTINVSSTSASMLITNSANTGNATMGGQSLAGYDNITAYYTTMTSSLLSSTYHMYIFADNDSSFYLNGWGYGSKAAADSVYVLLKLYTEQ
jgi:hypothetical protein